jgi:hypothetical protein
MPRRSVDARCGFAAVGVTDRRVVTDLSFSIISAPSAAGGSATAVVPDAILPGISSYQFVIASRLFVHREARTEYLAV